MSLLKKVRGSVPTALTPKRAIKGTTPLSLKIALSPTQRDKLSKVATRKNASVASVLRGLIDAL